MTTLNDALMQALLTACTGASLKMNDILTHPLIEPFVREHGVSKIRTTTYALATVGWLYRSATTNGARYQTTRSGREELARLEQTSP